MPHVINEIKLDFKDVLLRPKRSALKSRADVRYHMTLTDLSGLKNPSFQVNLHRKMTFLHSKKVHEGVPIIASNMDTVGTFEMAAVLAEVGEFE